MPYYYRAIWHDGQETGPLQSLDDLLTEIHTWLTEDLSRDDVIKIEIEKMSVEEYESYPEFTGY